MKIINFNTIQALHISPEQCVEWVRDVFVHKHEDILPAKISMKLGGNIFFNTMPCYVKKENLFGVKVVSRFPCHTPALRSDILLYDAATGDALALMDATWITAMRTGAVASLAVRVFQKSTASNYAFMGLGNTARATMLCLYSQLNRNRKIHIKLLRYKDQAEHFIERFSYMENVEFSIVSTAQELLDDTDVLISCVTALDDLFAPDSCYPEGILVVPVHTRGFQNCDLFFDKVFADDREHVKGFKYFDSFKSFGEISSVMNQEIIGRSNDSERILSYNIGIALHDIYFAAQIYRRCHIESAVELNHITEKFWL